MAEAFKLPDTGQTRCYQTVSPWAEIPCDGTWQDGDYDINPMSFTDNGDGTVTDDNTGLMWQQEDDNQQYNWYQATGTAHETHNSSNDDVCGFLEIGDYDDWRLPAKKELMTIIDYSIPYPGPLIMTSIFPNTNPGRYWSATTDASNPDLAWSADFGIGGVNIYGYKSTNILYVRCVRGNQNSQSLSDNGDTVTDGRTGLEWQKGEVGSMTWGDALAYCEGLSLANSSNWRLPNAKELESISDDTRSGPAIDPLFSSAYTSYYWTSTSNVYGPTYAWTVKFVSGSVEGFAKNQFGSVRCVKQGAVPVSGDLTIAFSGSGRGTVSGDGFLDGNPASFSIDTGATQQLDVGTSVSLTAAPSAYSLFTGWTGDCSGAAPDCNLTMTADTSVTAGFDIDSAHKTLVGVSDYYPTLQEAYDNAANPGTVKAWGTEFNDGGLTCNLAKDVTFKGGYDEGYESNSGYTTLQGTLTIHGGSVVMENMVVR
jgi:hypothetical protein